jgi:hypothetical protein
MAIIPFKSGVEAAKRLAGVNPRGLAKALKGVGAKGSVRSIKKKIKKTQARNK